LLGAHANSFSGGVSFGGNQANIRDVALRATNLNAAASVLDGLTNLRNLTLQHDGSSGIVLGAFSATGNVSVGAGFGIAQAGAAVIGGASSFHVDNGSISLTQSGNIFTGPITLSGSGVQVVNGTATTFATSTIAGDFAVTSSGPIGQTGAL